MNKYYNEVGIGIDFTARDIGRIKDKGFTVGYRKPVLLSHPKITDLRTDFIKTKWRRSRKEIPA